jgi:ribosomal protein S18 acetylase RimI-like enzyme
MAFNFIRWSPADILARLADITAVYGAAFTPPPYQKPLPEIAAFARSLPNQLDREDYRFCAAIAEGSELAGFAYGHSVRAGLWWQEQVRRVLPEQVAAEWLPDSFEFVELAVDPRFQRQGIGARLHDHLLGGVAYDRAMLTTMQADTPAYHLYQTRGWAVLGTDLLIPEVPRRYQVMGLDLRQRRAGDHPTKRN